jgi:hypothetical protein
MITHNNESGTSSSEEMSSSDSDVAPMQIESPTASELTHIVEFEAYPPADEDWSGVRALLDSLLQGVSVDVGYFSQTLIDNYKVGTVIKGADIEEGEDDPVFAVASLLPLSLFKDKTKFGQLQSSLLAKCESDSMDDMEKLLSSKESAFLINAKFSNLPLQITAQLYKALKMELITERKENSEYNVKNVIVFGKSYVEPEERRNKKTKLASPNVKFQNSDLDSLCAVATTSVSWKVKDETLAPVSTTTCDEVWQGYRSLLVVPIEKFLKSVDKIVENLSAEV